MTDADRLRARRTVSARDADGKGMRPVPLDARLARAANPYPRSAKIKQGINSLSDARAALYAATGMERSL